MPDIQCSRLGATATVTISHPARRNAMTVDMWQRLPQLIAELNADDSLRCVIIRGAAGNFCAGADLSQFAKVRANRAQAEQYHEQYIAGALRAIAECRHPTVASIDGWCTGGGFIMAASCDIRVAADSASFGIPIGRLGFNLAPQEIKRLVAVLGVANAREILLEGRILTAAEAYAKGFVSRVVNAAEIGAEVAATARRIEGGAPLVTRMHKRLLNELEATGTLSPGSEGEAYHWADSRDYREGIEAFLAKRIPNFEGK